MGMKLSLRGVQLTCDGDHGDGGGTSEFSPGSWWPTMHHNAMAAGWKETQDIDGRKWLGPCCSGKAVAA